MSRKYLADGKTKFLDSTMKIVNELYSNAYKFKIIDAPYKESKVELSKIERGFNLLAFNHKFKLGKNKSFKARLNKKTILIDQIYFTTYSFDSYSKGNIDQFSSIHFDEKKKRFYRLVIKTEKRFDFSRSVQDRWFATESHHSSGGLNIYFRNQKVEFFSRSINSEDNYIFFDSTDKIEFEEFSNLCFSISLAFGFTTGEFYLNEGIFFNYSNVEMKIHKGFRYLKLRKSINTIYAPVYNNPYSYKVEKEVAEKFNKELKLISEKQFSKLCREIYDSGSFTATILLILESMSSSLIMAPTGLSVVLESLTELICKENPEKIKPISVKRTAKSIRKELLNVIEKYSDELDSINNFGKDILIKKIQNINSPTNRDKLIKPFEILKIPITIEDKSVIDHRNDFLHGKITIYEKQDKKELEDENNRLFYLMLKLFTLNSALVLKRIGFKNFIVNYPKVYFRDKKLLNDEEVYRRI